MWVLCACVVTEPAAVSPVPRHPGMLPCERADVSRRMLTMHGFKNMTQMWEVFRSAACMRLAVMCTKPNAGLCIHRPQHAHLPPETHTLTLTLTQSCANRG